MKEGKKVTNPYKMYRLLQGKGVRETATGASLAPKTLYSMESGAKVSIRSLHKWALYFNLTPEQAMSISITDFSDKEEKLKQLKH